MSDERAARPAQSPIGEGAEIPVSTPSVGDGGATAPSPKPRCKPVNREQMTWAAIDVERLVPPEHLVRPIWELVGQLDLSRFWADTKAVEGVAGCSPYDPRLLISLWVLAYSDKISSAREVARRCEYHPAYQWPTGMSVMQDGTKVKAAASPASFQREAKLRQHVEEARERVRQMGDPRQDGPAELSARQRQPQERAAREKLERLGQSLEELQKVRAEAASADPAECRASETEPEARKMKQAVGGGFAPSYNVQLMTDAAQDIIVGVKVVQARNDQG